MVEFNRLLRLAIKAQQTVKVSTDPTESDEHVALILRWYSGQTMNNKETPQGVYAVSTDPYGVSSGATVVLNGEENFPHVGELTPPQDMIIWKIRQYSAQPARYRDLVRGFSLSRIDYLFQMASAMTGKITQANILLLLDIMEIGGGLDKVQTLPEYYMPHPKVVTIAAQAMAVKDNPELAISGIMFEGGSGTGKTSAATYMANRLALPAYRLDLTSTLGKYYGQSEHALREALAKVDAASPCVVLFDEVEKVLGNVDDSLVRRLVSTLLWWLENKPHGVMAIMTCNDSDPIPSELYRPGRIDKRVELIPKIHHNKCVANAFGQHMEQKGYSDKWKTLKLGSSKTTPTAIIGTIKEWYRENEPTP